MSPSDAPITVSRQELSALEDLTRHLSNLSRDEDRAGPERVIGDFRAHSGFRSKTRLGIESGQRLMGAPLVLRRRRELPPFRKKVREDAAPDKPLLGAKEVCHPPAAMRPEQRSESARKGVAARWARQKACVITYYSPLATP